MKAWLLSFPGRVIKKDVATGCDVREKPPTNVKENFRMRPVRTRPSRPKMLPK